MDIAGGGSIVKEMEVDVPPNKKVNIEVELPADFPVGKTSIKLLIVQKITPNRMINVRGKGKGKVWMAEDFDAPLEDFAEYMQ